MTHTSWNHWLQYGIYHCAWQSPRLDTLCFFWPENKHLNLQPSVDQGRPTTKAPDPSHIWTGGRQCVRPTGSTWITSPSAPPLSAPPPLVSPNYTGLFLCKPPFLTLGGISGGNSCTNFTSHKFTWENILSHYVSHKKKITKSVHDEDFNYNNVVFK